MLRARAMEPADPTRVSRVQIYDEDTDHSGLVDHANYLKYFERPASTCSASTSSGGSATRSRSASWCTSASSPSAGGAVFGDTQEVRTTPRLESNYREAFQLDVYRGEKLLVQGQVQMVCVDGRRQFVKLPPAVTARL